MMCPFLVKGADLAEMWRERLRSVVAVEFVVERELDRQPRHAFGVVANAEGLVIFPNQAMDANMAPEQFTEFRVYIPGEPTFKSYPARYLGHDELTGWEFLQIDAADDLLDRLTPISGFKVEREPRVADEIWGIGLRKKEENFAPYFMQSRISLFQQLPQRTALATREVAGPGLPVFNGEGEFVGLGISGFGQAVLQFSERDRGGLPVVMINPDECAAILLTDEVVPYLDRIPGNLHGRPMAWLGSSGLQPLDPEVARFLRLENQSGLVVNEILEGSPAAQAGLQARDILLSIDGTPFPLLKPDRVLIAYFQREVDRRSPGESMQLGVLRGATRLELTAVLTDAPGLPREAPRRYYGDLGMTVRAFTYVDGVARHLAVANHAGVIVTFVKPNSAPSVAGLRVDDWITAIDGVAVETFAGADELLRKLELDEGREEFTLQVTRGTQDTTLKVKLN